MTQLTLEQQLRFAAEQYARHLKTLGDTDYAVSAYQQSRNYVTVLKRQIDGEEKKVRELASIENHDTLFKPLTQGLSGEEEVDNVDWACVVQTGLLATDSLEYLRSNLEQAEKRAAKILQVASFRNTTQLELDEQYNQLFPCPTPSLPDEDEKENAVWEAENNFNILQLLVNTEEQTIKTLHEAHASLDIARKDFTEALDTKKEDVPQNGYTGMNAYSRARSNVYRSQLLMDQARRLQPAVGYIGTTQDDQHSVVTDVLIDDLLNDFVPQRKREHSRLESFQPKIKLEAELNAAGERLSKLKTELDLAKMSLDWKRRELQWIRVAALDRLADEVSAPLSASLANNISV